MTEWPELQRGQQPGQRRRECVDKPLDRGAESRVHSVRVHSPPKRQLELQSLPRKNQQQQQHQPVVHHQHQQLININQNRSRCHVAKLPNDSLSCSLHISATPAAEKEEKANQRQPTCCRLGLLTDSLRLTTNIIPIFVRMWIDRQGVIKVQSTDQEEEIVRRLSPGNHSIDPKCSLFLPYLNIFIHFPHSLHKHQAVFVVPE